MYKSSEEKQNKSTGCAFTFIFHWFVVHSILSFLGFLFCFTSRAYSNIIKLIYHFKLIFFFHNDSNDGNKDAEMESNEEAKRILM